MDELEPTNENHCEEIETLFILLNQQLFILWSEFDSKKAIEFPAWRKAAYQNLFRITEKYKKSHRIDLEKKLILLIDSINNCKEFIGDRLNGRTKTKFIVPEISTQNLMIFVNELTDFTYSVGNIYSKLEDQMSLFNPSLLKSEFSRLKEAPLKLFKTKEEEELLVLKSKENEPKNPFPVIFKNGYAYQMFLELKELTVNEKSVVAGYSYIFHKMKNDALKAINATTTEPAFIDFLMHELQVDISGTKLPYRNPANKLPAYTSVLNKYKEGILK